MQRKLTYNFNAQCPYLNEPHYISIDYIEFDMLGSNGSNYKKGSYYCDKANNCPYPSKDKWGRCPVYLDAPSRPE
ncbi:hypothetical protein KM803_09220 [Clostridium tyrobutyricum]|uniref:hypothetical protein n=1 Tax=Clostridium tyrobutyricum TaxID=1519 RepID=UPI001C37FEAB|nr:hypothetical protein [Clostridium tyrobutyricum]MBV4430717.1 hypothetical protein [Clostridium tyrobutyricum]MBV4431515.1 hypothetical protein [Clostridium tyrobutyricum]